MRALLRRGRPLAADTPLRRCSACCLAWYCGKDCQRLDRARHAAECRKGRKELRDAVRAAEARRLDGFYPRTAIAPPYEQGTVWMDTASRRWSCTRPRPSTTFMAS